MIESIHAAFRRQGYVRVDEGRVLGGVLAGLGRRFGIEPWPARLWFTLGLMLIPGSQLLVYPLLWILMPSETTTEAGEAASATPPASTFVTTAPTAFVASDARRPGDGTSATPDDPSGRPSNAAAPEGMQGL